MAINLNNLKKSITVATVLTIASCLVPESAQAIILRFSGTPNTTTPVVFNLDTSVENSATDFPDSNIGLFRGAVQQARLVCNEPINSSLCRSGETLAFNPGDLSAFLISDTEVQYKATLYGANSNVFSLTIQVVLSDSEFNSADLADSLSKLSQFLIETETYNLSVAGALSESSGEGFVGFGVEAIEVPEPDAIGSLLGAGAISTLLLLKHSRRSRKLTYSTTAPE